VRFTALVESLDHVCCRYRLRAFQPRLEAYGHALELRALPRSWWDRLGVARQPSGGDAVILQRKLLSGIETALLRRRARQLIFDFDDAIWLRDSFSRKGPRDARRSWRFQNIVAQCDAIAAGNSFLAAHAASVAKQSRIEVVPTCVDVGRYELAAHQRPPGQATFVWIGSSSTLRGLEAIEPLLERLGQQAPGIELKLICDRFLNLRHLRVVACPWSEANEASELAAADVGLSWVPDDLWSRGKCGLKVLQYMAAGLPVIANPVGVQASMVRHGETGFLARTEPEWIDFARTLAHEPELRRRMGAAGRRLVEERFSVEAGARLWAELAGNLKMERISA
jgi:glycosyltransferase involved in cell wall biosynthesis